MTTEKLKCEVLVTLVALTTVILEVEYYEDDDPTVLTGEERRRALREASARQTEDWEIESVSLA